ncbi:MAG TPA: nucleotide sugar dehydrogenase [Methylomirabilota bacterium]|nr:nucleotide sugar dehydrogenase [Methylomirabilota bacterium]
MSESTEALQRKIESRAATVAIVGMGYVGLSLAVELARAGYRVHGIDLDVERVSHLNRGESYLVDVAGETLAPLVRDGRLSAATSFEAAGACDVLIICVPTPLRKSKEPDISSILGALENLLPHLRRGQLMILESTTFPGTTEEVILPRLLSRGWVVGSDFFLAFSPERVDPGNRRFTTSNIPKVVGGVSPTCTRLAATLYQAVTGSVFEASSPRVAETAKLLENTFRSVNIALANELAVACRKIGVDPWEVIEAAATKPFGFMPFYPGPGIGGHCIPVDPLYLSWKIRLTGYEAQFIALADQINRAMPEHVVDLVTDALNERGWAVRGASILVLGVTYKPDVNDIRESPALEIVQALARKGAQVAYADPFVPELALDGLKLAATAPSAEAVAAADCVLILTNHTAFDYAMIADRASLVVDTRNAMKEHRRTRPWIVTL